MPVCRQVDDLICCKYHVAVLLVNPCCCYDVDAWAHILIEDPATSCSILTAPSLSQARDATKCELEKDCMGSRHIDAKKGYVHRSRLFLFPTMSFLQHGFYCIYSNLFMLHYVVRLSLYTLRIHLLVIHVGSNQNIWWKHYVLCY
jgi:hypothetical protein